MHTTDTTPGARKPNRLADQKSPYLLQHARNPVDWYPWGQEAFDRAKSENKPIFLSIGYSTCHWCHVMEKESFEDDQVAALMNQAFISIKVDREERPDLDSIYMTACQMLTGSGGWPLTVIMTPDKKPFFAGTYFPRESRFGRIGMLDLVPRVQKMWETDRAGILRLSDEITEHIMREAVLPQKDEPSESVLHEAFNHLRQLFDKENGGFSSAPKFPTPHMLLFLLRQVKRTGDGEALQMVTRTLDAMRNGGVYDHAGFGFHRYSTDARWFVPHFEKMLYDQAMLCMAYTEAFLETGNQQYRKTAEEILTYVLRDMTAPEGGFFSAEDADSEGEEGKYYVWSYDEIILTLGKEDADIVCRTFDVRKDGNFVDPVTGERPGTNILHRERPLHEIATEKGLSLQDLEDRIEKSLARLLTARRKRIPPHKDDKVLTDWNGLMIAALAKAAQAFQRQEYVSAAEKAADFILERLQGPDGTLLHRYREGDASLPAYVDDYAFFTAGLIELYEATLDPRHLRGALSLNMRMIEHFWDRESGGLFFTADDGEDLLVRKKEFYDGAIPAGSSVALMDMIRLARMTGNANLEEMAVQAARSSFSAVRQAPSAYAYCLCALDYLFGPSHEVVIVGTRDAADTREMLRALQTSFLPRKSFLFIPAGEEDAEITQIAAFTLHHSAVDNCATAYVCSGHRCFPPTTNPHDMLNMLQNDPQP